MATAVQKIASLGERRDIPFNKLILSQANVRKTKAGVSIPELAEDTGHRGLLQNLNVRPVLDGEGVETGTSRSRPAVAGSGRSNYWSRPSDWPRPRRSPATSATLAPRSPPRKTASPRTSTARRCIPSISSKPSRP